LSVDPQNARQRQRSDYSAAQPGAGGAVDEDGFALLKERSTARNMVGPDGKQYCPG